MGIFSQFGSYLSDLRENFIVQRIPHWILKVIGIWSPGADFRYELRIWTRVILVEVCSLWVLFLVCILIF